MFCSSQKELDINAWDDTAEYTEHRTILYFWQDYFFWWDIQKRFFMVYVKDQKGANNRSSLIVFAYTHTYIYIILFLCCGPTFPPFSPKQELHCADVLKSSAGLWVRNLFFFLAHLHAPLDTCTPQGPTRSLRRMLDNQKWWRWWRGMKPQSRGMKFLFNVYIFRSSVNIFGQKSFSIPVLLVLKTVTTIK